VVAGRAGLRRVAGLARGRRGVVRPVAQAPSPKYTAMSRYITIRMTVEQAQAACNACDLIRDSYEADNNRREAAVYGRASRTLDAAVKRVLKGNE
jgi:hypothetical protein